MRKLLLLLLLKYPDVCRMLFCCQLPYKPWPLALGVYALLLRPMSVSCGPTCVLSQQHAISARDNSWEMSSTTIRNVKNCILQQILGLKPYSRSFLETFGVRL